ncbi:MAG: cytochrome C biogenesis protein ResC [Deltaproteobacteria bacterium RIFOXYD12_FULL_57_12]|nr:MAG: cytochrome C biogenesis protein ResC [Deltaproteobacteria bacterium RIFOXYD12_FULL_57_12]
MSNPLLVETVVLWLAIGFYVVATIMNVYGLIFNKEKAERTSYAVMFAGLVVHGTALVYRWQYSGHGPYMTRYEVLSSNAWVGLFLFSVFVRIFPRVRVTSMVVFPAVFLLTALGLFMEPGIKKLPPSLRSVWLVLHVTFYKIALGTLLIALGFSVFYLLRRRTAADWLRKLPEQASLDLYAYRFVGFGFVFWAIAMLAGSIWAYQSWGRFWGWDPVEIWSLVTWFLFGMYLHLRRFHGWQGERAAWFYLFCFFVSIVAIFFTPLLESSIHSAYFQ